MTFSPSNLSTYTNYRMNYYQCTIEELHKEIRRRGYTPSGCSDQLSEWLKKDDDARGSDALTVTTDHAGTFVPKELNLSRTAEFGPTVSASALVNQKIVHWTMNTFFPTLHLFFESGQSCTIEGGRLPDSIVGLDPRLRFRLTDCTHEEDGQIVKGTLPEKYPRAGTGLTIRDAFVAKRMSVVVKAVEMFDNANSQSPCPTSATITQEVHTVIGLRLKGMKHAAYVWAKTITPWGVDLKRWVDVRIAGLRNDIPAPIGYLDSSIKPGSRSTIVVKKSIIHGNTLEDEIAEFWRY